MDWFEHNRRAFMGIPDGGTGAGVSPDGTAHLLPDTERGRAEADASQDWAKTAGRPVVFVQGVDLFAVVGDIRNRELTTTLGIRDRAVSKGRSSKTMNRPVTFQRRCRIFLVRLGGSSAASQKCFSTRLRHCFHGSPVHAGAKAP